MAKAKLRIFPAVSRNRDPAKYAEEQMCLAQFSEHNGFSGILLFEGNDVFVEPWSMAQHILGHTRRSSPLIAVNPIYMHPFTVAKFVSSFAQIYRRKVYLNMITGTAVGDLNGLGDDHPHDDRYVRLGEFIDVVRHLLSSPRPLNFRGKFYTTNDLQLRPRLPAELFPEFLVAGQSEAALRTAARTNCIVMQMLPPDVENGIRAAGANFGIFAREDREQARMLARQRFPDTSEDRELLDLTMENTPIRCGSGGSVQLAKTQKLHDNGYWLLPFLTFRADCPYLVGSYAEIGAHDAPSC